MFILIIIIINFEREKNEISYKIEYGNNSTLVDS